MKMIIDTSYSGLRVDLAIGLVAQVIEEGIEVGETVFALKTHQSENIYVECAIINNEKTYSVINKGEE